ncbi:PilZ domain-containing protein [Sphingomonas humi]|uniref:PilZ domain-containing protein n=1 Tax=Sphingomonas humi TaxID=335630 RepID=A0ABP7RF55_9SPHN
MNVSLAEKATTSLPVREDRRPVALHGWLTRRDQEQAHDFFIDNLSYGGCRIQSAARLARGDQVNLTVHRRGVIPGTVRWHNAYGIGVSFTPEVPDRTEVPRRGDRLPLKAEVMVRQTGRRARALAISDLSRFGCSLSFEDRPFEGECVWVALPGLAPVEGRVRWADGREAGVEFVQPIYEAVFELLLVRMGLTAAE